MIEIRFGKPCIKGTRISVDDINGYLDSGMSIQQIITDFPQLTIQDVLDCIEYLKDSSKS